MIIYIIIALFTGCVAFVEVFNKSIISKYKWHLLSFYTLFLIIFIGFRDCGFDYENYKYYYKILHSDFWKNNADFVLVEKGYALLNFLLPSFRTVYLLFAIVSCSMTSFFLYKYSRYPFLSHFLLLGVLVYLFFMGQFRQGLAIPIVLFALVQQDYRKKLLLIIIASFMHTSAILALLAFFVPKNYIKGKYYLLLLFIALIVNIAMTKVFSTYIHIMPSFIAKKLEFYSNSEEGMRYGINLAMLLRLIILCIFYKYKKEIGKTELGTLFFNYYFMALLLYLGLGFLPQLSGRGSIYFYIFEVILMPIVVYNIPKLRMKMCIFSFFILIGIYRQISFFKSTDDEFIPYKTVLSEIF